MDGVAYTHAYASYEEVAGIEYEFTELTFNWYNIPSSAWLSLLAVGVLGATLSIPSNASAYHYVRTGGACLNARTGPGMNYPVKTCVSNGARLARAVGSSGGWLKLETGAWVNASYTSTAPGGRPGWRSYDSNANVRPNSSVGGTVVLSVGSRGPLVRQLQQKLGVAADGVYGPATQTAVYRYQRARGLAVDGVAGPQTTQALGLSI